MSTLFEVPCPQCGGQMHAAGDGEWVECPTCALAYHARMGHLFPIADHLSLDEGTSPGQFHPTG
jgi:tRNA(Ile2) C34 agmatinyltransferase TiaS